ncbi:hypothetical protein GQ600_15811 [Phytophthora cactorum]|nr:hypothetical protein GQ600_15811 [Phytophthora cactorum]
MRRKKRFLRRASPEASRLAAKETKYDLLT